LKLYKKYQKIKKEILTIEGHLSKIDDIGIYFETPDGEERLEFGELLEYFKDENVKVTIVMNKEVSDE